MDIDMDKYHAELHARQRRVRAGREARREAGVYDAVPSVPGLFRHKDVFVTGASGFLGRVLVEKLLRCCPDIGTVYVLLRPKKGVAPADRVHSIVDVPLFDRVRREQPAALAKLVAVAGDCADLGLGIGAEDRALLQDRVAVVFHGAASVRFDDPLQKAVLLNTRGTRELVELCLGMKKLKALVHISTAYTNTNQSPIEERLYPTSLDWRQVIQAASDPAVAEVLDNLGHKFLGFHPNTYTFTKALSEQVMGEAAAFLPVIIIRPAVVIGAVEEPLVGWLDNVNSPAAMWMAINKGVLRCSPLFCPDMLLDYVPVDLVAKGTVLAAWARATNQDLHTSGHGALGAAPVVNLAISDVHPVTGQMMLDVFIARSRRASPYSSAIRYPYLLHSRFRFVNQMYHFFYHILFGLTVDLVLRLTNRKPMLMKVYRKIEMAVSALHPFTQQCCKFETRKFWKLQEVMHPDDEARFDYGIDKFDPRKDGANQVVGILEYALKEKFDREKGLRHIDRLFWLEAAFYGLLVAILLCYLKPFSYLW